MGPFRCFAFVPWCVLQLFFSLPETVPSGTRIRQRKKRTHNYTNTKQLHCNNRSVRRRRWLSAVRCFATLRTSTPPYHRHRLSRDKRFPRFRLGLHRGFEALRAGVFLRREKRSGRRAPPRTSHRPPLPTRRARARMSLRSDILHNVGLDFRGYKIGFAEESSGEKNRTTHPPTPEVKNQK